MGRRQTETYLDTRAIYSEAEYLRSVLLWLQGESPALGGFPKTAEAAARRPWSEITTCLPARISHD
jgi:hypothetical protein